MKRIGLLLLLVSFISNSYAQDILKSVTSKEKRIERHNALRPDMDRVAALEYAKKYNLPIRVIDRNGSIIEIRRLVDGIHPEYLITNNLSAAKTISTDKLWEGVIEGIQLDGDGIVAGVWDAGDIRTTHVEFENRAIRIDTVFGIVGHATHVAGTIAAAGLDPEAQGMAKGIAIEGYDWINDVAEMQNAAESGMLLSNHSYGLIHGFHYNIELDRWEWYGYTRISEKEDYNFGFYGEVASEWDNVAFTNPGYLIVKSAGNDRFEGPDPGEKHFVWENKWNESDSVRNLDGGPDGFDCIGTESTAKNILTVGAVEDIESGYQSAGDVIITGYSVFGPTDDGRIKPDIVANGQGLKSTFHLSDNDYKRTSGTSMSAPSVTGSLALIQQFHFKKFSTYLKSSSLKAIVLHTADDAGHPGPDYKFGWGLMNAEKAARFISESVTRNSTIIEDRSYKNQETEFTMYMDGVNDGRLTLCWTDPAGKVPDAALDPETLILENDLDMRLIRISDQALFSPYMLDPKNPDEPASTGDNFRDNIEQIHLTGSEGFYSLLITQKASSLKNLQDFSLVCDGIFPVTVAPEFDTLSDVNGAFQVTDAPVCPSNSKFSWLIQPENNENILLSFRSFETNAGDVLKIYDGNSNMDGLLGAFSGELINKDTMIYSTGSTLFLEFETSDNSTSKGFTANYCTSAPEKITAIVGENMPCIGNLEIYDLSEESGTDYRWGLSSSLIDTSILSNGNLEVAIGPDEFDIYIIPSNLCGDGESTSLHIKPINSKPEIVDEIAGDTLPCLNLENYYSVQYDANTRYQWIIPEGWSSSSDSSTLLLEPKAEEGTLMVIPFNSCGVDDTIKLSILGKDLPPDVSILSDNNSPCQNSELELYLQATEGIKYKWETDKNSQILGADTLSRIKLLIGESIISNIQVTSSNICGDTVESKNIFFSPLPDQPQISLQESSLSGYQEISLDNFSAFSSISWLFNDSIISNDQESILIQRNGQYGVAVTNTAGCSRIMKVEDRININEEALLFSIYGSDIPGQFIVINDSSEEATLEGYDVLGKAVFSVSVQPGINHYHTPDRGMFVLKISADTHHHTQMIILH